MSESVIILWDVFVIKISYMLTSGTDRLSEMLYKSTSETSEKAASALSVTWNVI